MKKRTKAELVKWLNTLKPGMVIKQKDWDNFIYYKVLGVYPRGKELPPKGGEWRTNKRAKKRAEQQRKKENKSFRMKLQVVFSTNRRSTTLYDGTIVHTEVRDLCALQPVSATEYKELLMRKFEEA